MKNKLKKWLTKENLIKIVNFIKYLKNITPSQKIQIYKFFKLLALLLIIALLLLSGISLMLSFNLDWFSNPAIAEHFVRVWKAMESVLVALSLPISSFYYLNMLNGLLKQHLGNNIDDKKIKEKLKQEIIKSENIKTEKKMNLDYEEFKIKNYKNWVEIKNTLSSQSINLSEKCYIEILKEINKNNCDFYKIKKIIFDYGGINISPINLKRIFKK